MRRLRPHRHALALGLSAALVVGGLAACTDDKDSSDGKAGGPSATTRDVGTGDTYEATIRRTTDGVPHITGATLADAAFGQGYASGEDRTCDLADQIVKIRGERSKFWGAGDEDANLKSDTAWRAIGIFDRASKDWETAPDQYVEVLSAFTAGWNAHLKEVGVDGLAGWCKGADWVRPIEPVEVYAYARAISLQASSGAVSGYIATARPPGANEDGTLPEASTSTTVTGASSTTQPLRSPATPVRPLSELGVLADKPVASNGWAIGAKRSADGGGMLVANPHFPWEGELRFWEVQLTVPGKADIYGVQLSGLPGIGIGFTKNFGWTHTVSAGNRFTAYKVSLVPGSPTTYRYGTETREMTPTKHEIEVKGDDGKVSTVERTTWATHYGPVLDFPGFGWTADATITLRDANIDDDEFFAQYLGILTAKDLDAFQELNSSVNGVPLFNTIAVSADGRAWYADTSATPNLSKEALAAYETSLAADPIVKVAADNGAILLDGSDPKFEWVDEPGARDPGLVPPSRQPKVERDDYVFNANDSFWVPHATALLEGDYSPLHGRQKTPRSPRTRENAVVLDDTTATGPSGADGKFTLDELADAALRNEGFLARALRGQLAERCKGVDSVAVPEVAADDDIPGLPAATVDLTKACAALAAWDGRYDLDSAGAPLFREFASRFSATERTDAGRLWAKPFDPAKPVETPSGLAPANGPVPYPCASSPCPDPLLVELGHAVQALDAAGFEPDVTLGETQFALRNGHRVPIHGGTGIDGTTNVVGFGTGASILDPAITGLKRERLVAGSSLARVDGEEGYLVNNGTSFLMALHFGPNGPEAKAFLDYSDTEDRTAKDYLAATERFSQKKWRTIAFTEAAIEKETRATTTVHG
jgi:acyl-homoserine-lactone acylase